MVGHGIGWVGIVGHVAVGYLYLSAGLVAPLYGILILWALWVGLLVVAIWLLRKHPVLTIIVPLLALGILFGGLALGEGLLGWQA